MAQSTKIYAGPGRFKNSDSFQRRKKSGFVALPGIPSFHDAFRPLLSGDYNCYVIFLPTADQWDSSKGFVVHSVTLTTDSNYGKRDSAEFGTNSIKIGPIVPTISIRSQVFIYWRCQFPNLRRDVGKIGKYEQKTGHFFGGMRTCFIVDGRCERNDKKTSWCHFSSVSVATRKRSCTFF
jgi:hypothetical protein